MQLSLKEIEQLTEALQVWEKEPMSSQFQDSLFGGILGAMSASQDPALRQQELAEFKREEKKKVDIAVNKARQRKELSILIQAKLINERNRLLTEGLAEESQGT